MKHFRSLFDSLTLSILMGCYLTVFVPSLYFWPGNFYRQYYSESLASVILALLVMGGTKLLLNNFAKMPNVRQETYIIPVTIFGWRLAVAYYGCLIFPLILNSAL